MILVLDWKQAQTVVYVRQALQCRTSGSIVHVETKRLKLRPNKTAAVHGLPSTYCEPRIWYCTQSQRSLFTHLLETQFTLYSEETRFTLSWYIKSLNNTQSSTEIPHMVLEDPSYDFKVQMLCRISERGVTEPIFGQNNKFQMLCKINSHTFFIQLLKKVTGFS